ncbi:protein translocase subunit SecF [Candidatus Caldatribacterium sp.]|uniref:protein translocase subunit SecF n=1 Tax=Candidatus Caldatribacterium sp. TaxID=2282143 RepID=UPI00299AD4B5|nr:protein translocase subunit SecF [Candidatus Caldatribacterium sp.]MDW8081544.1 protein translocase subunit SecF [Candidatus Calescibacterium sp.]
MEFIKGTHINFMGVRRFAYVVSLALVALSLGSITLRGLNYGIDFAGGTLLQFRFSREVTTEELRRVLGTMKLEKSVIQRFSPTEVVIRTPKLSQEDQSRLTALLREQFGVAELLRIEDVGPAVGADLRRMGIVALLVAIGGILVYVAFRFEFRPAVTAILALAHDGFIVIGTVSLLQKEFTIPILAAVLTILGYSINDSIVVMDRVRENLVGARRNESLEEVVNRSINETLSRTINTALTTALPVIALYFFGGKMLQDFALAILVGLLVGTYSSIFVVSALWVDWERRRPRRR